MEMPLDLERKLEPGGPPDFSAEGSACTTPCASHASGSDAVAPTAVGIPTASW